MFVTSLPGLLIASAATGFAGALFNPAVRAYLAADAGERRVEAFALFNIFYQAGILAGPLVGLALMAADFRVTAGAAAVVFAILTVTQLLALPTRRAQTPTEQTSVLQDSRTILGNRRFVVFAMAMIGSYVLSFQVFLALPLQAQYIDPPRSQTLTAAIFVISGLVAVASQLRITAWLRARWGSGRSLAIGMGLLAAAFLPLALIPGPQRFGTVAAAAALLVSAALLAIGTAAVFPFEMDTIVSLASNTRVARVLQHRRRRRYPHWQPGHRHRRRRSPQHRNRLGHMGGTHRHRHGHSPRPTRTRPTRTHTTRRPGAPPSPVWCQHTPSSSRVAGNRRRQVARPAAAAGALSGAVVVLTRQAVTDPITAAIALVTLGLLWRFKIKEPYIVVAAGILGILLH